MKYIKILISLFAFAILSCKNQISQQTLIGSWQETDILNAGDSILEKITFDKKTVTAETIIKGKVYNKMSWSYILTPDLKFIVMKVDTSQYKDEIIKMTSDELELRPIGQKKFLRFKRIN